MNQIADGHVNHYPLVPITPESRTFESTYRIRVDDVDPEMTVHIAAVARYLQDIALDMTQQSEFGRTNPFWLVRRNVIDVIEPITWPGNVTVKRWCSATSAMWVSMRQTLTGLPECNAFNPDARPAGRIETESFCINVTREGRPARIDENVLSAWSGGVTDRRLRWRVLNPKKVPDNADQQDHLLRPSDFDMFHHMNNATYWQAVDRYLMRWPEVVAGPYRAVIEYLNAVPPTDLLTIRAAQSEGGFGLWFHYGETLTTTVTLTALPRVDLARG
ncbi:acyl-ACP thioesterase domain-containing protein [Rhodococcus sp. NPDC057014]|uniref:acyl-ACP thioesterase domain-containing protein n=1 Tax=Rhodococcus sp. NPDC057014 TaxID=3346000 RepID=UPI003638A642